MTPAMSQMRPATLHQFTPPRPPHWLSLPIRRCQRAAGELHGVNWWSVAGLICDIAGVIGVGLDSYVWTKSAPLDVIPDVPAMTRFGRGVPRWLYRVRNRVYWS